MRGLWAIVFVVTGCEKKAPRYDGPLRVDFGDCATDPAWVSGPRPLPLDKRVADNKKPDDPEQGGEGAFASLTGTGDISSGFDDTNIYGGLLGNEAGELNGGFGYGRSGPSGTVNSGRYGTIGGGSGTGYGRQGTRSAVPTVIIGQPTSQGDLDKAIIRRYIKRNISKFQYCYEKQLLAKPTLAGTILVQFFIQPDGKVATATGAGVDAEISTCVATVIKNIEFPKPKGGGGVHVSYPFTLRLPGDLNPRTTPGPGTGLAGSGSAVEPPNLEAPKPEAPKPRVKPKGALEQGPYKPGVDNPLVARRDAIEECLRTSSKPYGALVVELAWTGLELTKSTVHGADSNVAECVSDALKQLPRTSSLVATQSCSLAFGTMPAADLPGVDIADSIKFGGVPIATTQAVVDDKSPTFKIDALFEKADAGVKRDRALTAPVTIIGPLVVRPLDATPIAVVNKVLDTMHAAGADFVFAANRDGIWRLLKDVAVPVVPVPNGTGGSWSRLSRQRATAASTDSEVVQISLLVQKDKTWIGLSRVNEFQEILANDLEKLKKALHAHKKSAFFAGRVDIDIAGELVTYGDVVKAIEVARDAGFVDWTLVDPAGLAARPIK